MSDDYRVVANQQFTDAWRRAEAETLAHVNEWFDGAKLASLPPETEPKLRDIARAHSIALGRVQDDLNRLCIELAISAEAALEMGQDETGEQYGHGVWDGLARASIAVAAVRDSLEQWLAKGPGAE